MASLALTCPSPRHGDRSRACVHVEGGSAQIVPRDWLPRRPRGDLLQAGPLLVAGGGRTCFAGVDPEGFAAAAHQFDSDITQGRHPRAALGLAAGRIVAVACDGRSRDDAGLTLAELAWRWSRSAARRR